MSVKIKMAKMWLLGKPRTIWTD